MVISLCAKGLTTGEIQAHLSEVYSADISRETISKFTGAGLDEVNGWLARPLDRVYPVVFIDAIHARRSARATWGRTAAGSRSRSRPGVRAGTWGRCTSAGMLCTRSGQPAQGNSSSPTTVPSCTMSQKGLVPRWPVS